MKFARIGSNIINLEQIAYLEVVSSFLGRARTSTAESLGQLPERRG